MTRNCDWRNGEGAVTGRDCDCESEVEIWNYEATVIRADLRA
ncbi:hypothetical protein TIFTF001_016258 [Ficus carica]|uniref:Uncharacterized protein n=1 Tax=Ficus carica TaxID=3494 RepID=A0AA88DIT4_FICCA|nr:hypothetical protein TIFTF001_016258 [Ficus carica]